MSATTIARRYAEAMADVAIANNVVDQIDGELRAFAEMMRQNRELAAKLALTERAKAQQEDMVRTHIAEIRAMLNDWENGRERIARYERELIPLAKDRTQAALAAYRGAKGDLNTVLAARRNEIEVRTQTLQLEMDTARIWAQLEFLVPDGEHEMPSHADAPSREVK